MKSLSLFLFDQEITTIATIHPVFCEQLKAVSYAVKNNASIMNCEIFKNVPRSSVLISLGNHGVEVVFNENTVDFYRVKVCGTMVSERFLERTCPLAPELDLEATVFTGIASCIPL